LALGPSPPHFPQPSFFFMFFSFFFYPSCSLGKRSSGAQTLGMALCPQSFFFFLAAGVERLPFSFLWVRVQCPFFTPSPLIFWFLPLVRPISLVPFLVPLSEPSRPFAFGPGSSFSKAFDDACGFSFVVFFCQEFVVALPTPPLF